MSQSILPLKIFAYVENRAAEMYLINRLGYMYHLESSTSLVDLHKAIASNSFDRIVFYGSADFLKQASAALLKSYPRLRGFWIAIDSRFDDPEHYVRMIEVASIEEGSAAEIELAYRSPLKISIVAQSMLRGH